MAALLELNGISRWYGQGDARVDVLKGVALTVKPGETVAIVGPSGSGKSTLLHIAGLLDRPDAGEVVVDGKPVAGMGDDAVSALRGQVCGFVYQYHHLLREFTALENVMMPALIGLYGKRAAGSAEKERAEGLLASVGLTHRMGHFPTQLSGGEQQRVALARALMNKPKLLLADEPTGNLDPHTAEGVVDGLFQLVKDEKLAVLMVTHNPALAARCQRTLVMREGVLAG